jgi:hypothetical protein
VTSGSLAALIVMISFAICCTSAPVRAEQMRHRGCCSQRCSATPISQQPAIASAQRGVERPLAIIALFSHAVAPHSTAAMALAAAATTSPPLFAPLETIQLRI